MIHASNQIAQQQYRDLSTSSIRSERRDREATPSPQAQLAFQTRVLQYHKHQGKQGVVSPPEPTEREVPLRHVEVARSDIRREVVDVGGGGGGGGITTMRIQRKERVPRDGEKEKGGEGEEKEKAPSLHLSLSGSVQEWRAELDAAPGSLEESPTQNAATAASASVTSSHGRNQANHHHPSVSSRTPSHSPPEPARLPPVAPPPPPPPPPPRETSEIGVQCTPTKERRRSQVEKREKKVEDVEEVEEVEEVEDVEEVEEVEEVEDVEEVEEVEEVDVTPIKAPPLTAGEAAKRSPLAPRMTEPSKPNLSRMSSALQDGEESSWCESAPAPSVAWTSVGEQALDVPPFALTSGSEGLAKAAFSVSVTKRREDDPLGITFEYDTTVLGDLQRHSALAASMSYGVGAAIPGTKVAEINGAAVMFADEVSTLWRKVPVGGTVVITFVPVGGSGR